jgi:hypothetical protein
MRNDGTYSIHYMLIMEASDVSPQCDCVCRQKRVQQREESMEEARQSVDVSDSCVSPSPRSPVGSRVEKAPLDPEEMLTSDVTGLDAVSVRKGRQSRVDWVPCAESLAAMETFRSEVTRVYGLIDCGKLKVDKRSFPRELDAALLALDKTVKRLHPDVTVK